MRSWMVLVVLVWLTGCRSQVRTPTVATFSIVAYDPATEELGVAVQSKFLAVGAVVPWAKAGVGAIATQSWANTTYGPRGLELLSRGNGAIGVFSHPIEAGDTAAFNAQQCYPG